MAKNGVKLEGADSLLKALSAIGKTASNIMSKEGQVIIEEGRIVNSGLEKNSIPLEISAEDAVRAHDYRMLKQGHSEKDDGTDLRCDPEILDLAIKDFIEQQIEEIK